MSHISRCQRKKNARKRAEAAAKQEPLTPDQIKQRTEANAKLKSSLYPEPPTYRDHNEANTGSPSQKVLRGATDWDLIGLLAGTGLRLRRR